MPASITRRASYGGASSVVGERGARTRREILDGTLRVFAANGVHNTLVADIVREVGISRATLYQYFESRDQLFVELADQAGSALLDAVRAVGELGPTAEGVANLRGWLTRWAEVYDRYATIFVQWPRVDAPDGQLRPLATRFVEACTAAVSARFVDAGLARHDAEAMALAVIAMTERCSYSRHTRRSTPATDVLLRDLASVIQLALFPATPAAVLAGA